MALTIPLKTHWPVGFRSNYITAFPDFAVYISWRKLRIGKIDGRPIGWWHDLGYWRGMIVHPDIKLSELRKLQPLPNAQRSEVKRRAIDLQLYAHARQLRYTEVTAAAMYQAVRTFGAKNYFLQDDHWDA